MIACCPGLQSKSKLLQGAHFIIPALDELDQHYGPSVRHCKAAPALGSLRSKPDKAENSPELPFPRLDYFRWTKLQVLAGSIQLRTICFVSSLLKRYQGEFFPLILFWEESQVFDLTLIAHYNSAKQISSKGAALPLADPLGFTLMSVELRHLLFFFSPAGARGHHHPKGKQHFVCTQEQGWSTTVLTWHPHSPRCAPDRAGAPGASPRSTEQFLMAHFCLSFTEEFSCCTSAGIIF